MIEFEMSAFSRVFGGEHSDFLAEESELTNSAS
jgi:hypothetical protein